MKFWDIGNEPYGSWQLGRTDLKYYVLKHNEFASAMRKVDPSITLLASGAMPDEMTVTGQARTLHMPDPQAQFGSAADFTGGLLAHSWGSFDGLTEHWYARAGKRFDYEHAKSLPPDAPNEECVTFTSRFGEPVEKAYIDAVQQGYLPESKLDTALIRLFTARMKLGMFDPPDMVPYTKIDEKELDSAEHRALARKLANESMVLLKNDGTLPLKPGIKKIAVIGPLGDETRVLLGNYAGNPTHSVTVLDGLKAEFPNATITFVPGTQFRRNDGNQVLDSMLTTPDGKPGVKAEYSESMEAGRAPELTCRCLQAGSSRISISVAAIYLQRLQEKKPPACVGRDS